MYLGKYMYKIFENPQTVLDPLKLSQKEKMSIFFRALYFLENVDKRGILPNRTAACGIRVKDQLVHMLKHCFEENWRE